MARLKGSDELYRLIHSLSTEEKGYFKKFALRHTSQGNNYLELFDAICTQKQNNEQALKKQFVNYAKVKMYLKEMLIECLLVYHRKSHPHISLLGQLQKIHLMIIKGLYKEAFKLLEKAIDECVKMELFTITRYLLHLDMELKAITFSDVGELIKLEKNYNLSTAQNMGKEANLTGLELMGITWLSHVKGGYPQAGPVESNAGGLITNSLRAEIKKLSVLFYEGFRQNGLQHRYRITKMQMGLVQRFRKKHDASFNIIPVLSNHIVNCIALKKFAEAERISGQMIAAEARVKLYYDLAFIWGNLYKWTAYFHTARFEKGLEEIETTQSEMLKLYDSISDNLRLRGARVYDKIKIIFLFCNARFSDCWLFIYDSMSTLKHDKGAAGDILMIQMMVQLELGNFEFLKDMSIRAAKKLARGHDHKNYMPLLKLFRNVSAANISRQCYQALQEMKAAKLKNNGMLLGVFGLLQYEWWLESKITPVTIRELVKREGKSKTVNNFESAGLPLLNDEIF